MAATASGQASAMSSPKYFVLEYHYVSDMVNKRVPYREQHLAVASKQAEEGKLILAGPYGDPVIVGGFMIWKDTSAQAVEEFVQGDPYFTSGLVMSYSIKPWNVIIHAAQRYF